MRPSAVNEAGAISYAAEADFTLKSVGNNKYNNTWTYRNWTLFGAANNNKSWAYVKFGGKNTTISSANPVYIKNNVEITMPIQKVIVSMVAGSLPETTMSVNSWGVYVYSDAALSTQIDYVAGGTITSSAFDYEFVPTNGSFWTSKSYFKVSFDLANTSKTNGIVWVDKVQLIAFEEAPKTLDSIAISGDMTKKTYIMGNLWNYEGLIVTANYSDSSTLDVTTEAEWLSDPISANDINITSLYLIAGYQNEIAEITIQDINVNPTVGEISSGTKYLITSTATNGIRYILKAGLFAQGNSATYTEPYSSLSNYTISDAWTFTTNGIDNQWTINGSNSTVSFGLRHFPDNNGVASVETSIPSYLATSTENGKIYLKDTVTNRYLTSYDGVQGGTDPNWRSYTSTTAQGIGSEITLVEYEEKILSSIAVTTVPTKTDYYVGESLNISDLVVTGTYTDSSSEIIMGGLSFSPNILSASGTQIVTITHTMSGLSTNFSVTVIDVPLTSISVTNMPNKTSYYLGNSLITTGLVVTGIYDNNEQIDVTGSCLFSPTVFNNVGTQVVTVTHTVSGLTTHFSITVMDATLTSIAVTNLPNQTVYNLGSSLVTTGLVVTGTYSNSQQANVTSDCSFSPTTFHNLGTQIIAVTHVSSTLTTTFSVVVNQSGLYHFGDHADFSSWTSTYQPRTLDYADFTMNFESADRETTTITNMPVSKGNYGIFTSKVMPIKSIEFGYAQWGKKTQTINLNKYVNSNIPIDDIATTLVFPSQGVSIKRDFLETDVMSVKISMSNNKQIGWDYVQVEFYDLTNVQTFATTFLESIVCDGGITPPSLSNWSIQASNYLNNLGANDRSVLMNTIANENGTIIEKCVARYDYIVIKYGDSNYANFMSRVLVNKSISTRPHSDYQYCMMSLIVILFSGLGMAGALFSVKKKHEQA